MFATILAVVFRMPHKLEFHSNISYNSINSFFLKTELYIFEEAISTFQKETANLYFQHKKKK